MQCRSAMTIFGGSIEAYSECLNFTHRGEVTVELMRDMLHDTTVNSNDVSSLFGVDDSPSEFRASLGVVLS